MKRGHNALPHSGADGADRPRFFINCSLSSAFLLVPPEDSVGLAVLPGHLVLANDFHSFGCLLPLQIEQTT